MFPSCCPSAKTPLFSSALFRNPPLENEDKFSNNYAINPHSHSRLCLVLHTHVPGTQLGQKPHVSEEHAHLLINVVKQHQTDLCQQVSNRTVNKATEPVISLLH